MKRASGVQLTECLLNRADGISFDEAVIAGDAFVLDGAQFRWISGEPGNAYMLPDGTLMVATG